MLTLIITVVVLVVSPDLTLSLPPTAIGDCTVEEVIAFISSVSEECVTAGKEVLTPTPLTIANLPSSLDIFCTAECGRLLAAFVSDRCHDEEVALPLAVMCLPTNSSSSLGDYCRYSYPDLVLPSNFSNIESCMNYTDLNSTCPSDCSVALLDTRDQLGCCYQILYNTSNVIIESLLVEDELAFYSNISNPALWSACDVELSTFCSGPPFPQKSTNLIGKCTIARYLEFFETLSETCVSNYIQLFINTSFSEVNQDTLDVVCTTTCGQAVTVFLEETCFNPINSLFINSSCLKTDSRLGDRCTYALSNTAQVGSALYDVIDDCSEFVTNDPTATCPLSCDDALIELASLLGCCYQSIFNDTQNQFFFVINGQFTVEMGMSLDFIGDRHLWDACGVPVVEECVAEPFSASAMGVIPSITLAVILPIILAYNTILRMFK